MFELSAGQVLMPVPLQHAAAVRDLLDRLERGEAATSEAGPEETQAVEVPRNGWWTADDVRRLVEASPYDGVLALGDAMAARAGQWVPKGDVEEGNGISPIQLRNELGAFSKAAKRVLGRLEWPFEYKKEKGVYSYRMPEGIAPFWLAAREVER
jgi:hypothetical protein